MLKEWIKRAAAALMGLYRRLGAMSLPVFFMSMVFLDYALRWTYAGVGGTRVLGEKPMVFTGCWALMLTALIALLPRLGRGTPSTTPTPLPIRASLTPTAA